MTRNGFLDLYLIWPPVYYYHQYARVRCIRVNVNLDRPSEDQHDVILVSSTLAGTSSPRVAVYIKRLALLNPNPYVYIFISPSPCQ